jgi:hypothetical protein
MSQFDPRLSGRKPPRNGAALGIAGRTPGRQCRVERGHVRNTAAQALLTEGAQLNLGDVQPTAVARGMMEFQAAGQVVGLLRRICSILLVSTVRLALG